MRARGTPKSGRRGRGDGQREIIRGNGGYWLENIRSLRKLFWNQKKFEDFMKIMGTRDISCRIPGYGCFGSVSFRGPRGKLSIL